MFICLCQGHTLEHGGVRTQFLHDITSASQKARMPSDAFERKYGEWCLSWNITEFLCLSFFWWLSRASLYTNFDELWMSALMSDYCYRVSLHTNFDVPWMSVSIVWLLLQELQFVVDRYAEEAKTWRQKEETLLKRINVSSNVSFICYSYSVWVSKWTFLCYINVGSNVTFICYTYSVWVSKWTFLCYINVGSNVTFICYTYSVWVSKWTFLCYINVGSNVTFICYTYSVWVSKWTFLCYISVGSNVTFICYTYSVWVSKWTFLCYINVGSNVTFICYTFCVSVQVNPSVLQ